LAARDQRRGYYGAEPRERAAIALEEAFQGSVSGWEFEGTSSASQAIGFFRGERQSHALGSGGSLLGYDFQLERARAGARYCSAGHGQSPKQGVQRSPDHLLEVIRGADLGGKLGQRAQIMQDSP
jgi:hypothetical protein